MPPGHDHPVPIGYGWLGNDAWTLRADVNAEGQLCLGVRWTPAGPYPEDDGCGFGSNQIDDEGRGTEPTSYSQAASGATLTFGPSPAKAVRATLTVPTFHIEGQVDCRTDELAPITVSIIHRLPAWYPVHEAGWFTVQTPPAVTSDCGFDVRFTDARGRTVAQPNNF